MAEGARIDLEIVTPDGVVLKKAVQGFTATSVDGEFGVLPGHRPLLAALRTGIVTLSADGEEERVAVGSGFAEISGEKAVLLTNHFCRKVDIDPVQARLDLKDADDALDRFAGEPGSTEYLELVSKELWAAARLTLYGDPPPPIVRTHHEVPAGSQGTFAPSEEEAKTEPPA